MTTTSKRFAAAVAVACACTGAQAATYYFANCDTGAASSCVPGDDASNLGTSASSPWRSIAKLQSVFSNLSAGDKVLFAQGGAWQNTSMSLRNFNATAANPIVLDSYTPSGGATARPRLNGTGEALFFFFSSGGYLVQNLDLRGSVGTHGVKIYKATDVTVRNSNIEGFSMGVLCEFGSNLKVQNSTLKSNVGMGVMTNCGGSQLEANAFDNNGAERPFYDHSIYVNSDEGTANDIVIRDNVLTNNSPDVSGRCAGVALVVHGVVNNLLIEGNKIYQAADKALDTCWGIAIDQGTGDPEKFENVVIRGNTVVNVGNMAIGCSSCIAPLIENNVIVQELNAPEQTSIRVPDKIPDANDYATTGATIRNNSIYIANPGNDSVGISFAYPPATAGAGLKVVSNLIFFGNAGAVGNGHKCFDTTGMSLSNFSTFNNNLCHHHSGTGSYSQAFSSLALAKQGGFDGNGQEANPMLAAVPSAGNNWSMALGSNSTAIDAGHASLSAPKDRYGVARVGTPDIGAHESSPVSCTSGPAWVRIATEYDAFTVPSTNLTRFGNTTGWVQKTVTNSGYCLNGYYGGNPPTTAKWCELQNTWTTPTWIAVAQEYQMFYITGTQSVRFGNASGWTTKSYTGSGGCTVSSFGVDPAPGVKRCEIVVQPVQSCSP